MKTKLRLLFDGVFGIPPFVFECKGCEYFARDQKALIPYCTHYVSDKYFTISVPCELPP